MSDNEARIRVYFLNSGMIDVMDDNTGDRLICTKEMDFVVSEIRRFLEHQRQRVRPPSYSCPPMMGLGIGKVPK